MTITRNGKAYDAADVTVEFLGNTPGEVYGLKYSTNQEHQKNYALGSNEPTSWSQGKMDHTASITLALADTAAIERAAQKAGFSNLLKVPPFPIVVQYFNEFGERIIDRLVAKFQSTGREVNNGGQGLMMEHELFVLSINYNQPFGGNV